MDKRCLVLVSIIAAVAGIGAMVGPGVPALPLGKSAGYKPLEVNLWMDQAPALAQATLLTLTVVPKKESNRFTGLAQVWVEFRYWDLNGIPGPAEDVQVVGNLPWRTPWRGFARRGEALKFSGTTLFPREGVWEVAAKASQGAYESDAAPWRLTVTQEMGEFCWPGWPDWAPPRPLGLGRPTPPQQ